MTFLTELGSFVSRNALLVFLLLMLAGFLAIHLVWYIRPSAIESPAELKAAVTSGKPIIVEYYTNL